MSLTEREQEIDRIVRHSYVPAMRTTLGRDVLCAPYVDEHGKEYPVRETAAGLEWRFEVPGTDPLAFSRLQITHEAAVTSLTEPQAFAKSLQREVRAMVYDLERELERQVAVYEAKETEGGDILALPLQPDRPDEVYVTHPDYGILNRAQTEYVQTSERGGVPVDQRELARRETW